MNFAALVLLLGLMGTVCGKRVCPQYCDDDVYHQQFFNHVSDLQNTSVAPWEMSVDRKEGRMPHSISNAQCKNCTRSNLVVKTIFFEISVYTRSTHDDKVWCRCPYKLAVGCTCVETTASHRDESCAQKGVVGS